MEISVNLDDRLHQTQLSKTTYYNNDTTIGDLIDHYFPKYENIYVYESECHPVQTFVDYYFHDDVLYWDTNPRNILVSDYLKRFPECQTELKLIIPPVGIGSGNFIDFITDLYDLVNTFMVNNPLAVAAIGYSASKFLKFLQNWCAQRKLDPEIHTSSFKKSIQSKTIWTLTDLEKSLEFYEINMLMPIMMCLGYVYDAQTHCFIFKNQD